MANDFSQSRRGLFRRKKDDVIRPPWTNPNIDFTDICTRCDKCTNACETKVIFRGDGGFPEVSFDNGECTFCEDCVSVCPEPVFDLNQTEPWAVKAKIVDSCLAYQGVWCQSCKDSCDSEAISFEYIINNAPLPKIDLNLCTGCGACLEPCPNNSIIFS